MEIDNNHKNDPNGEIYILVQRAKSGDEQAFKILMKKYYRSVYYLILKIVKNDYDAEDLTVEVFSKVFFNFDMYAQTHSFSTWLFKIASNHAIDFIRKKKNQQLHINIDEPIDEETNWFFEIPSADPNPEKEMIIKQHEETIKDIIEVLPEDLKIIIKLRFIEELSYKEISKKINQPIGTVKARIFRGRNLLASIIRKKLK